MRLIFCLLLLPLLGNTQPSYTSSKIIFYRPDSSGYKLVFEQTDSSTIQIGNMEILISCPACPEKEIRLQFDGIDEKLEYEDGATSISIKVSAGKGRNGYFGLHFSHWGNL